MVLPLALSVVPNSVSPVYPNPIFLQYRVLVRGDTPGTAESCRAFTVALKVFDDAPS